MMELMNMEDEAEIEADQEIFRLDRVEFSFDGELISMAVSNHILMMALSTNKLLRIDLQQSVAIETLDISKKLDERVYKIHFDPSGKHLLITMQTGENYYLYEKWKKPKPLTKLKGIVMDCVAWSDRNRQSEDFQNNGKRILIGTKEGFIFEAYIEPTEDYFRKEEKFVKRVFTLNASPSHSHYNGIDKALTSIHFEFFPNVRKKVMVLASTSAQLYQFVGNIFGSVDSVISSGAGLSSSMGDESSSNSSSPSTNNEKPIFDTFFQGFEEGYEPFYEFNKDQDAPSSNARSSQLCCLKMGLNPIQTKRFAWLSESGIFHGDIKYGNQLVGESVIENAQLLPLPDQSKSPSVNTHPLTLAITEYHILLLYPEKIQAICWLSDEVVFEEYLDKAKIGKILGLVVDQARGTYWLYGQFMMFEILVYKEDRDLWEIYLRKNQFDLALHFSQTEMQREKVLTYQADHYFKQEKYALAASYYAKTSKQFEEIALKFSELKEHDALKIFLITRLEHLSPDNCVQITLIATWIVEIYLTLLDELEEKWKGANNKNSTSPSPLSISSPPSNLSIALQSSTSSPTSSSSTLESFYASDQAQSLKQEFHHFFKLPNVKNCLDKETVYKMMASHGRSEEILYFSRWMEDWDKVISLLLHSGCPSEALEVIHSQIQWDLYYKYSPELILILPLETVNLWIRNPNLNPRLLLPAIMKYDIRSNPPQIYENQAVRYLEIVIQKFKNREPSIHNYLFYLYAKEGHEGKLLSFLQSDRYIDLHYALRLCQELGRTNAAVILFGMLEQYEAAVDLALQHDDYELAQVYAEKPLDDDTLRKDLWLKIAKKIVVEKQDIKAAMNIVRACQLLNIEDVLPFFPDFVLMNDFREEICASLETYYEEMDVMRQEMQEMMKATDRLRVDLRSLRNRYCLVSRDSLCQECDYFLFQKNFFIFSDCQHGFHVSCLYNLIHPTSDKRTKRLMETCQKLLQTLPFIEEGQEMEETEKDVAMVESPSSWKSQRQLAQVQLDSILSKECPYCGSWMIQLIERPFIEDKKSQEYLSWLI